MLGQRRVDLPFDGGELGTRQFALSCKLGVSKGCRLNAVARPKFIVDAQGLFDFAVPAEEPGQRRILFGAWRRLAGSLAEMPLGGGEKIFGSRSVAGRLPGADAFEQGGHLRAIERRSAR